MESTQKKVLAGALVFVGIIGIGAVLYNFIKLYTSMPSRAEVMNFAADAIETLPDPAEVMSGSLVPDSNSANDTMTETPTVLPTDTTSPPNRGSADWLTPGQRQMLTTLGIDESDLPATLTPELEACLVSKLGEGRVDEIKAGETPSVIEGMRAVTCL